MTTVTDSDERARLQRRTLITLRLAQVPGQASVAGVVAVVALLAKQLLNGSDRLAGTGWLCQREQCGRRTDRVRRRAGRMECRAEV